MSSPSLDTHHSEDSPHSQFAQVDACHASPAGQALKQEVLDHEARSVAQEQQPAPSEEQEDPRSRLRPRGNKAINFYDETCVRCEDAVSSNDSYLCGGCYEPGHAACHGLDEGTSTETAFVCKTCVDAEFLGVIDEALLTSGGAMIFADREDIDAYVDNDDENERSSGNSGRSLQQQRYEEQYFDEDLDLIIGNNAMAQFASDKQPDDDDRRRLVLLSLQPGKDWKDFDLDSEKHLRIGLLLLFNLIQGKTDLVTTRLIHIKYTEFSKKTRSQVSMR